MELKERFLDFASVGQYTLFAKCGSSWKGDGEAIIYQFGDRKGQVVIPSRLFEDISHRRFVLLPEVRIRPMTVVRHIAGAWRECIVIEDPKNGEEILMPVSLVGIELSSRLF